MKNSKITNILTKKLEETLISDKTLIYEILVEGSKKDIEQAIKNAIYGSINNVIGDELKIGIKLILMEYVKNNAKMILMEQFDLGNVFSKDVISSLMRTHLPELFSINVNIEKKEQLNINKDFLILISAAYCTTRNFYISERTLNCLRGRNIEYLGDLVQETEGSLLKIINLGKKSLGDIKTILSSYKMELGTKIPSWGLMRPKNELL